MEAVDKGLMFVGYADPAAEVEYRIVVIQGQNLQVILQFLKAVSDAWRVVFVGFCVGSVQLVQYCFAIRIAGVKSITLCAALQQL